jgi:D-alanyl-lipoteichoic acid acyltransferase DltB (MBOAT superfamily)
VLFNSFAFIFVFLPICLTVYLLLGTHGFLRGAMVWLFATSLFFYGWWNPSYLWLILASILFNYTIGTVVLGGAVKHKRLFLILGITGNLCGLGYYKYSNFFIENINSLSEFDFTLHNVILPLGISFFTFQQIAYLVDSSRRKTRDYNFLHYCLFVTFFPQLIAGPIVHQKPIAYDSKTSLLDQRFFSLACSRKSCLPTVPLFIQHLFSVPPKMGLFSHWLKLGAEHCHIRFSCILIFPAIQIWLWGVHIYLVFVCRLIFLSHINRETFVNFGDAGM